jgi:hypothetical protein
VAETVRNLRSESTRQTLALEKLHTRNADLTRQLSLAQSQERSARAALRTAESSARSLRDDMVRLKTTVQQVRTSCANDVRKRDVQIQRLKGHLTGQQRGNKSSLVGASITINPGSQGIGASMGSIRDDALDIDDPDYSLKQETAEFLTQLSQSLSDENDSLIGLARSTLMTLRELQGMPESIGQEDGEDMAPTDDEDDHTTQGMLHALPTSYETLANDTDTVLDNLKNLLTNPNFVSVEEVESREEEILRLRAGWEQMEARLRESFKLMDSWRKRMTKGDTINLDEFTMDMDYDLDSDGKDDISVIEEEEDEDEDEEQEGDEDDEGEDEDEAVEEGSSVFNEEVEAAPERSAASDTFDLKLRPGQAALKETNGNKSPNKSPRKVIFSASIPNTPCQQDDEKTNGAVVEAVDEEMSDQPTPVPKASDSEERGGRLPSLEERTPRHVRCDEICDQIIKLASKVTFSSPSPSTSPSTFPSTFPLSVDIATRTYSNRLEQTRKRLSSPRVHADERSPKLSTSMQDKLRACQAEAEAAEETKKQRRASRSPTKTRIGGRAKRRKSTLTAAELENLLGC